VLATARFSLEVPRNHGFNPMTIMQPSLTRRSETCAFDAAADLAASQYGLAIPGSGAAPLGIPARFKILSEIGNGGMGIVYKVRDLETGEIVALKLVKPEIASDPQMREELRKEVCLARKVTHKNVCRIHEFYRSNVGSCISMEFVDGETLSSRLRRIGALPVRDSIEITRQICAGLREAHSRGIVHRDLKPANIMIDRSGVVKIMDFGIARLSQESGQVTRTIVGTPEYMAPEQLELKAMGPRTDIYSLGLLLYEMVTGSQAFTGDSSIAVALKQIRQSPKRPSEIVSTLPPGLEAIILKCLRKNCDSRFQSIDHLDAALCKAAANVAPNPLIARFGIDVVVEYASAKWRVLVPELARLGLGLCGATHRLSQIVHNESKRLALLAATSDAPGRRKNRRIQIAAVVTVTLLSIFLLALVASKQSNRKPTTPEAMISPSLQNTEASVSAQAPSVPPAASIAPGEPTEDASQQNTELNLDIERTSDDPSTDAASSAVPSSDSVPQSRTPIVEPVKKRTKTRPILTPLPLKTKPSATNIQAAVPEGTVHSLAADQTAGVANAPTMAASLSAQQPAAPATVSADQVKPNADKPVSIAENYLEVGSFKDTKWADDAVERLSQQGFHAICVHKTVLWMQSYHVQVGPYATSGEIGDAQERLSEQGIKSHIVK
jgi:serine/threonine protein kinase